VKTDRIKILQIAKDFLTLWGTCTTSGDFISKFLLKDALIFGRDTLRNSDILTEFFKHSDLITPYAYDLCREFEMTSQQGTVVCWFVAL
jgi:hypothetical protein